MENAAKALLIGAGVIFTLLIISLLVVLYNKVSSYYEFQSDMTEAEQLQKFNARFENYHDKKIRGSELVSIMNMIIDYNNLQADARDYDPVNVEIDLKGHQDEIKYKNEAGGNTLITGSTIHNNNGTDDTPIRRIAETSSRLSTSLGISDVNLQRLSASINHIVDEPTNSDAKTEYKNYRKQLLKRILKYDVTEAEIDNIKKATYQYYQFTQFKRAMFECTSVTYNTNNGRVKGMTFEVILENDASGAEIIKFD